MKKSVIGSHLLKLLGSKETLKINAKLRRHKIIEKIKKTFAAVVNSCVALNRLTYSCEHSENLPGKLLLTENSQQTDNLEALIVHKNIGIAYDFFSKVLKLNSIDNKGMKLISSVNYGVNYENAYWNSSQMVFGDGSQYFKPFGRALDVTAHELAHGVTDMAGPKLIYLLEPGALNEAFSDIVGISAKHWSREQNDPQTANWYIGDEIVTSDFPGKALRSFKNEQAYSGDIQPKLRSHFVWTKDDDGGVHINSGIINHLFYKICVNLKSPSYLDPLQLFWATHKKLWSHSSFGDFKKKLIASSEAMFGKDSPKHKVVLDTLVEVGF